MFPDRIRVFNKHVTNRLLKGLAHASRGPFAMIYHTGRRSSKAYATVIMVWPLEKGFVIALTYGPQVDWYRNIQAAEGCTIRWHKKIYTLGKPEAIDAEKALTAFPAFFRSILSRQKVKQFIWLQTLHQE